MKRLYIYFILFICSMGINGQEYTGVFSFEEASLRETGDSVSVDFSLRLSSAAVERGKGIRFIPSLYTGDSVLCFPDILIEGSNKKAVTNRWRRKNKGKTPPAEFIRFHSVPGTDIFRTYSYQVPYQEWMDSARFVLYQELIGYNNRRGLIVLHIPSGIERISRPPYEVQPLVNYILPEPDDKRRKRQGQAYLSFQVGRSVILPEFRNNPTELEKVNIAIADLKENPDVEIYRIFIEGYASPEGSFAMNERLSRERAGALKEYLKSKFVFPEQLFQVNSIAEDWEGVIAAIENSTFRNKEDIVRIIRSTEDPDKRESQLKNLSGGALWRQMLNEFFPSLRRVEYQIDYSIKEYTLEEASALLEKNPEHLSLRELYLLALHYGKDSDEYVKILLEISPRCYPDDPVANYNTAALLLERGEYHTAARYLEKAGDLPATLNNKAIYLLVTGQTSEAKKLLEEAVKAGIPEAEHNLQETARKMTDDERQSRRKK